MQELCQILGNCMQHAVLILANFFSFVFCNERQLRLHSHVACTSIES